MSKIGQTAAAMTDHGNIYGAVHFFDAMQKKGIKPILGCELYICKNDDHRLRRRVTNITICWCSQRIRRAIATWFG